jgi:hypothetical protein
MMASRLEASGYAPYQVEVYREMLDIMADCSNEEATEKFRNPPYYTAPALAKLKDSILAHQKAAEQIGLPEAAAVYQAQLEKLEREGMDAYNDAGYLAKAQQLRNDHFKLLELFSKIYQNYLIVVLSRTNSDVGKIKINNNRLPYQELQDSFQALKAAGGDFYSLANDKRFREAVPCGDDEYEEYLRALPAVLASLPKSYRDTPEFQSEFAQYWAAAEALDPEKLRGVNEKFSEMNQMGACVAVSPDDENGKYTYINEVRTREDLA